MPQKTLPVFHTASNTYTATSLIGEGGAGMVYSVSDDDKKVFAVKALRHDEITSSHRKRFMNELKFCQEYRHDRIVRVLDCGFRQVGEAKYPFFVMPLYPATFRKKMQQKPTPEILLRAYSEILDGVEAAHLLKVWHRDLKPENILLDEHQNRLVVTDFGIAHFGADMLATEIMTKHTDRLANFQYAAPEQRDKSGRTDQRTDIYSLGLILNEMFTAAIPHGSGYRTIADAYNEYAYLDPIVDKMIQQSPDRRYRSLDEVKQALQVEQALFTSRQKLSMLEGKAVSISEPDDPLIKDPIKIASPDYRNGHLRLSLSRVPTQDWINSFRRISGHTFIMGSGPENFGFSANQMTIAASPSEAPRLAEFAKDYVQRANQGYVGMIRNRLEAERIKEEQRIMQEREEERVRQNVLQNIKF